MARGIFVASNVLPASELNAVTDPPRCRVYNSANISIASATATALTFNTETYDVGAMHSTSVNTGRITCPTDGAGWYTIGGCVRFAANTTGYREVKIQFNGTTDIAIQRVPNSGATDDSRLSITTDFLMTPGDYVELVVAQNSGGALNVIGGLAYTPMFYAKWNGV